MQNTKGFRLIAGTPIDMTKKRAKQRPVIRADSLRQRSDRLRKIAFAGIGKALPPQRIDHRRVEIEGLLAESNGFIVSTGAKENHRAIVEAQRGNRVECDSSLGLRHGLVKTPDAGQMFGITQPGEQMAGIQFEG